MALVTQFRDQCMPMHCPPDCRYQPLNLLRTFFFFSFCFALPCASNKRQITDALRTSHRRTILVISRRATARRRNEQTDKSTINLDFIGKIYVTSFRVPFNNTQDSQITKLRLTLRNTRSTLQPLASLFFSSFSKKFFLIAKLCQIFLFSP